MNNDYIYIYICKIKEYAETNGSWESCDIITCGGSETMYRDAYWILRAAIRITISGPVLCFRAWRPRLRSKCDTHAYLHYKNVLENGRTKISSWPSKSHYSVGVYATCRDQKLANLVGGTQFLNFATSTENGINKHSQMIFKHIHNIAKCNY